MKRSIKHSKMPKWIWQLPDSQLNFKTKRFLAYIWWSKDRGCRDWNYQIEQRFKKSKRTIYRWIAKLKRLRLITVNYPSTKHRTIYRRPYFSKAVWLARFGMTYNGSRVPKMAHTNNAKHREQKDTVLYPTRQHASVVRAASVSAEASVAGKSDSPPGEVSPGNPSAVQGAPRGEQNPEDLLEQKKRKTFLKIYKDRFSSLGYSAEQAENLALVRYQERQIELQAKMSVQHTDQAPKIDPE